jgi:UDP-GlcNAc3NAcA epimerase
MKIITIIGARPQFIKAAPVSKALLDAGISEKLLHTGQHYDAKMSGIFFSELGMATPSYKLGIGGESHGAMTGGMLKEIERILIDEKPDAVLIYGDTNSTLAGALAASKLLISVVHIEAGLRSFNKRMPEEQNRICADHLSSLLLCTGQTAVDQLKKEGIVDGVQVVGDVMVAAQKYVLGLLASRERGTHMDIVEKTKGESFALMTLHRQENTDNGSRLHKIVDGINASGVSIILPLHPRTRQALERERLSFGDNVILTEPLGYLAMTGLLKESSQVITDSGGLQKEAYWMRKPCYTLRDETEWVETLEGNWNRLVNVEESNIAEILRDTPLLGNYQENLYGDGEAAERCARSIYSMFEG